MAKRPAQPAHDPHHPHDPHDPHDPYNAPPDRASGAAFDPFGAADLVAQQAEADAEEARAAAMEADAALRGGAMDVALTHSHHDGDPHDRSAAGDDARDDAWGEKLLDGLTPPQKEAVLATEGPLLVLAAAGSGKTRVITRRIAHLIAQGVPPWSILAVTFTNKAAGEMRERVLHLLGGPESRRSRGLTVTTFHSLCARLLRRYAEQAGLAPEFTILDSGDQAGLVKKVIEGLQLSTGNFPPRSVLSAISHAKNQLLDPEAYAARAFDFSTRHIAKIYAGYAKALRAAQGVDFDDLLMLTAKLLQGNAGVRAELHARWQYLLVDEYQDTNRAQFEIASSLIGAPVPAKGGTARGPNICVVGDPDQAIYGWRGADISNILDFERHYPGCRTITLGENFRSDATILAVADALITKNKKRKHKPLFTSRTGGAKVEAVLCAEERHEAHEVVSWFQRMMDERGKGAIAWKDCAVFYRTNALSRVLEEAFRGAGVPYTIARGTAFYEREEVRTALAYLRLIANTHDDVSLERVVNTPARGISDATLAKISLEAARAQTPMLQAMRGADASWGLQARALASVQKFVRQVDSWSGRDTGGALEFAHGTPAGSTTIAGLADLVDRVLKESGIEAMYRKQAAQSQSETDEQRLDNLSELVTSAREFELEYDPAGDAALPPVPGAAAANAERPPTLTLLRAFLESISLVADADSVDPASGSVTLMTLHAAKGLEFPAVAIVGMEDGMLPHARALTGLNDAEMEEERRLCFVGITRAMHRLMLTSARYRTVRGISERTIPSRFLGELDASHVLARDLAGDAGEQFGGDEFGDGFGARQGGARFGATTGGQGGSRAGAFAGAAQGASRPASGIAGNFPPGCKVRHPQFGVGVVVSVTPGAQARAKVDFQDVGSKTLILEYARLTRL